MLSKNLNPMYCFTRKEREITQKDENDWFENYDLNFKIDTDNIKEALVFSLEINDNLLNINQTNIDGEIINEYSFKNLSTEYSKHNLLLK